MKKLLILLVVFFIFSVFAVFAVDQASASKYIVGKWVSEKNKFNQIFYYSFFENGTGYVYYTQNGKKIGEYNITYRIEDVFLIHKTPGGEIVWEIKAITETVMIAEVPGEDIKLVFRKK